MRMQAASRATAAALGDLDGWFRGFADPTRLRILNVLAAGELCVCDIVNLLGFRQPTISRHLAYLRRTGLVQARQDLRFTYYRLVDPAHPVHQGLFDLVRGSFRDVAGLKAERRAAGLRVRRRSATPCR